MARRGRPAKNEEDRRTREIKIRFSDSELAAISEKAALVRRSVMEYMREALNGAKVLTNGGKTGSEDRNLSSASIMREFIIGASIAPPIDKDILLLFWNLAECINEIREGIETRADEELERQLNEISDNLRLLILHV